MSVAVLLAWVGCARVASAQTATGESKGYVEAVAQSAFGNVTSQSFGVEAGVGVWPRVQVFGEVGFIRDAAPSTLGDAAQRIASGIAAAGGVVDFRVRQPVTFGVGGLKYTVPSSMKVAPYLMAGGGVASVKRDVSFNVSNGTLSQYATIGSDLSGTETKPMLSVGVGVTIPFSQRIVGDVQYRYGRIFTSEGLNANRAGAGIGVRF